MKIEKAIPDVEKTQHGEVIRLTAAQALVQYLQVQYTERDGQRQRLIPAVFGIFGHGNVTGLGQALQERGQKLPYYQTRNEQNMVHLAIGYARTMHRRATLACASSIGPGATNMITGAATATINRLPVLLLAGDYYASRRQGNVLQQLEHPVSADVSVNDTFRPVSRFFDRILRPEHLLTALPEAMRVLTDTVDTGAVTLSLPQDVQTEAFSYPARFLDPHVWPLARQQPDMSIVRSAIDALATSSRPAIIAGGGVHYSEAWSELREFSDAFGIPVAETFAGKGSILQHSELLLGGCGVEGNPAANAILRKADLIFCLGTRLSDFITASRSLFQGEDVLFVSVNADARDAFKLGALPIVADLRDTLRALIGVGRARGVQPVSEHVAEVRRVVANWNERVATEVYRPTPGESMSQGQVIGILNEEARPGDVIVAAAGGPVGDLLKVWNATEGRAAQLEFGYSCMGHELPAALGVRLASRDSREVVALIGDGTFLMNPTELITALQDNLKVTLVIVNNHGFQVIRRLQMFRVGVPFGNEFRALDPESGRLEGNYLDIDLATIAAGMGARTWNITDEDGLRTALREARSEKRSCVIVVEIEKHHFLPGSDAWWDAAPPEMSRDPRTQELRAEYERDRGQQRFFG